MANIVFTIGAISATVTAPSDAKARDWVQGYIAAFAQTPQSVQVPEGATQTQTLQAALNHLMRHFRRMAIQATARNAGQTAEAAALATGEVGEWS